MSKARNTKQLKKQPAKIKKQVDHSRHYGHPKNQPYAFQSGIRSKKIFDSRAVYYPDANSSPTVDLSNVLAGTSDNERLSDTVVFTHLEINGRMTWGDTIITTTPVQDDVTVRLMVIASIDNNLTQPIVDAYDPLTCIDNTKVPSQCTILYDTGPKLLTCKAYNEGSTFPLNHLVHTVHVHKPLFPQGDNGVWAQYAGDTQQTGRIFALFLSDAPDATNRAQMTFSFALEFHDVVKGLAASVNSRIDTVMERMNTLEERLAIKAEKAIKSEKSNGLVTAIGALKPNVQLNRRVVDSQ